MENYLALLEKMSKNSHGLISGYSDEELYKIESLYDISLKGQLRSFLSLAGRCDAGLIGDDPLILYRETWNARSHLVFQLNFINELQDIGAWEYINKPFVFSLVSENRYYYLMTAADTEDVFVYDEIKSEVRSTGLNLEQYLSLTYNAQPDRDNFTSRLSRGDLLRF